MLTCYGHEIQLTQSDLAYVGFRLAALDTLSQMVARHDTGDDDIDVVGYLAEVPLLAQAAPAVQMDLLANVWSRHRVPELHEASLVDAAIVFAAFCTAGREVNEDPERAGALLKQGRRRVRCRLHERTSERLQDLFFAFWDDQDFLSMAELQDLTPEHARVVREVLGMPDEAVREMEDLLSRVRASPAVLDNLERLLTPDEIVRFGSVLLPGEQPL